MLLSPVLVKLHNSIPISESVVITANRFLDREYGAQRAFRDLAILWNAQNVQGTRRGVAIAGITGHRCPKAGDNRVISASLALGTGGIEC
ncbi:hypothetical protein GW7_15026 [Heterocephalus glaber]|uniref:Uncharacterized protein n=1 Tax=Heterocephalus glaber TaxID=10181 RepID=G5BBH8_HETGA|nr:hypothetical protein GW7_15026 [Heterocephalus glaber]